MRNKNVNLLLDKKEASQSIDEQVYTETTTPVDLMIKAPDTFGFHFDNDTALKLAPSWGLRATILVLLANKYGMDLFRGIQLQINVDEFAYEFNLKAVDVVKAINSIKGVNVEWTQLTLPLSFEFVSSKSERD